MDTPLKRPSIIETKYYDDWDASKNYRHILYKPGIPVQARELTQQQTSIQYQLAALAAHSMKDGTPINGARISYTKDQAMMKVTSDVRNWETMKGIVFYGQNTDYIQVDDVIAPTSDSTEGWVAFSFLGRDINYGSETFKSKSPEGMQFVKTNQPWSTGVYASCSEGEMFVDGYIIHVEAQSCIIDTNYDDSEVYNIGFLIERNIVTAAQDSSLNDNANGSSNFNAPGADRYQITATLFGYKNSDAPSDEVLKNFVAGIAMQNDTIILKQEDSVGGELLDVLAKRTYEESGSYSVTPWSVVLSDDENDSSKFIAAVQPGIGYIQGYRVENAKSVLISVDKPREYLSKGNSNTYYSGGAYTVGRTNAFDGLDAYKFFNYQNIGEVYVCSGENGTGVSLGKCNVYGMNFVNGEYRIYLSNLSGVRSGFAGAKSLCSTNVTVDDTGLISGTPDAYVNLRRNALDYAELYNQDTPQIVKIPHNNIKGLQENSLSYNFAKTYRANSDATGKIVIEEGNTSPTIFEGTGSVISIISSDGFSLDVSKANVQVDNNSKRITISLVDTSNSSMSIQSATDYDVTLRVKATGANSAAKNVVTVTNSVQLNPTQEDMFLLTTTDNKPVEDAFEIVSVTINGTDVTKNCVLLPNQTDYTYEQSAIGGLTKAAAIAGLSFGSTAPVIQYTVRMYEHVGDGPFTATSYGNQYDKIQTYTTPYGVQYNLRDCIDFRVKASKLSNSSDVMPSSISGVGHRYPLSGYNVECVPQVYLPRYDTVWVDRFGVIDVTTGISSETPCSPTPPNNALVIAYLYHQPYMVNTSQTAVKQIRSQRYTMQDISMLEDRISRAEKMLSLSMLEQSAVNMQIVDESGYDRYKSGIFTDNFSTLDNANWGHELWNCTIDSQEKCLRPQFYAENVSFNFEESNSTAVKNPGGIIVNLPETSTEIVAQNLLLSDTINLQEYMFFRYDGQLTLTPSVDTWVNDLGNIPIEETYIETPKPANVWRDWMRSGGWIYSKEYESVTNGFDYSDKILASFKVNDEHMRQRWVKFSVDNMRQGTSVFGDIDNVPFALCFSNDNGDPLVNSDGKPVDTNGNVIDGPESQYQNNKTDSDGHLEGWFKIPANVTVGEKIVTLSDAENSTDATSPYQASGITIWNDVHRTYIRHWDFIESGRTSRRSADPIAQSFTVEDEYGMFLSSIDLFFASKDNEDENAQPQPVVLYIVECENGYPTMNEVPLAEAVVACKDVNILSEDDIEALSAMSNPKEALMAGRDSGTPYYTRFKFHDPVYLQHGKEYAFVVMANSYSYSVYISRLGNSDLITEVGIYEQPILGSLFMSQNRSTWNADQNADITFVMHKSQFTPDQEYKALFTIGNLADYKTMLPTDTMDVAYQCLCARDFIQSPCSIVYSYRWSNEANFTVFNNMDDKNLDVLQILGTQPTTGSPELEIMATMKTTNKNVSPQIDSEAVYGIFCQNILSVESQDETSGVVTYNAGTYISRTVEMENSANTIKLIMDVALPYSASIKPYIKTTTYQKKYVVPLIDNSGIMTDSNQIAKLVGKTSQIYYRKAGDSVLTPMTRCIVSGWNGDNELFISTAGNPDDFKDWLGDIEEPHYDFTDPDLADSVTEILIMDYVVDTADDIDCPIWTNEHGYSAGQLVWYGNSIWRAQVDTNIGMVPSNLQAYWQKVAGIRVMSTMQTDTTPVEWREMECETEMSTNASYVEYTFHPKYQIETEFTKFSIRIDMFSRDKVHVPTCKNLRAIAVV